MPVISSFMILKGMRIQFHLRKAMLKLARLRRVHCRHAYNPFSNIDPALWLANALKKSRAVPVEIIAGHRQIKPSQKAKHAAGIYSSNEEESKNEPPISGSKHKVDKKASSTIKKQKLNDALIAKTKRGQAHKSAHVDSEDIESTDDNAGHTEESRSSRCI